MEGEDCKDLVDQNSGAYIVAPVSTIIVYHFGVFIFVFIFLWNMALDFRCSVLMMERARWRKRVLTAILFSACRGQILSVSSRSILNSFATL